MQRENMHMQRAYLYVERVNGAAYVNQFVQHPRAGFATIVCCGNGAIALAWWATHCVICFESQTGAVTLHPLQLLISHNMASATCDPTASRSCPDQPRGWHAC